MKTLTITSPAKEAGAGVPQFRLGFLLPLALFLVAGNAPWAHGQQYRLQQLNFPGSTYSFASGLNSRGVVVGSFVDASSAYEGFVYKDGKYKAIVFPGSAGFTQASGVNDANTIVGEFTGNDQLTHGFLLSPDGDFTQYDVATGASTHIYGINNAGNFVGFTSFQGQTVVAFVDLGGTVTEFTFMGLYTFAFGINNKNEIVGDFITPSFTTHGFYRDAAAWHSAT